MQTPSARPDANSGVSFQMPRIGLGTWRLGERSAEQSREVAAVRHAIELGYRLIDSAEMYGEGGAERIVGRALAEAFRAGDIDRDALCIVSKVYPHNASRDGVAAACRSSLERLGLERIDLYLLHWRGQHPLAETVDAFERLRDEGRIGRWGVSNFDVSDMQDLWGVANGRQCAVDQIYLSLSERGAEHALLPWLAQQQIAPMAYSPIDQGELAAAAGLRPIAERHAATPAQIALAALLALPGVVAIPKAVQEKHLRENLGALDLRLTRDDLDEINRIFPPPQRKRPLAMI